MNPPKGILVFTGPPAEEVHAVKVGNHWFVLATPKMSQWLEADLKGLKPTPLPETPDNVVGFIGDPPFKRMDPEKLVEAVRAMSPEAKEALAVALKGPIIPNVDRGL
jgi:hypothetical protein